VFREIRGFGAEMPVAANSADEGRIKNRRVEVWVYWDPPDSGRPHFCQWIYQCAGGLSVTGGFICGEGIYPRWVAQPPHSSHRCFSGRPRQPDWRLLRSRTGWCGIPI